jgi:beta-lactamase class A
MKIARDAFPKSAVLIYANFMPGEWLPEDDKGYLRSIYEYAGEIGVGVGGPDLQPFKKGQLHHSYPLIRDRKKGVLAGVAVQEGNYAEQNPSTHQPISVPELYGFGKDTLHLDYVFWCTEEPFFSRDVVPFATRGVANTPAETNPHQDLQSELHRLTDHFDGHVGVCVQDANGSVDINGGQSFSLQSVMKLVVGMAVMDAVDDDGWRLDERVVVRKQDLSLYVQPIAKLVTADGFQTTIGDLVRRGIVDSDSAVADILVKKLGGPAKVQAFLDRKGRHGVRFDRDEKHLQTEIVGLEWRPEYVDPDVLQRATDAVPKDVRDAAYRRYQADVRDTATPEGMASLLQALASGHLLSADSTEYLLEIMAETRTFPDRLKEGLTTGWTLGHKTGTSGSWEGVTAATNDVGILTAPDGSRISVVVFIADSGAPERDRAALMARISQSVIKYRPMRGDISSPTTAASSPVSDQSH